MLLRLVLMVAVLAACSRGDEDSASRSQAPVPAAPADASIPLPEMRGRRLCSSVFPPDEVAKIAGMKELVAAAGWPRAASGTLRCLYLWPATGNPEITVELNVDCRELRPKISDLAHHWKDAGALNDAGLFLQPAPGVQQLHGSLEHPPCYLSVTTGFTELRLVDSLLAVARSRLEPQIVVALGKE